MLKIVLTIFATEDLINIYSITATTTTKRNTHQLSNSRSLKTLPLVKLMSIPATKPFVITINSRRWPPAKLLIRPKERKQKNRQKKTMLKPLLIKALVTGSY